MMGTIGTAAEIRERIAMLEPWANKPEVAAELLELRENLAIVELSVEGMRRARSEAVEP